MLSNETYHFISKPVLRMTLFKKYFQTLLSLFKNPRQVIDSFLHEKPGSFVHPFKFCLMGILVVIVLSTLLLDFSFEPVAAEIPAVSEALKELSSWTQIVSVRAATQFLPLSLFLLFVISLSIGAVIFLKGQTNGFFDHIIISTYSIGAALLALPLLIPVWGLSGIPLTDPFINSTVPAMVVAGVVLWIYNLYFRPDGFMQWIRILSAYVTGYVIYVLLMGLASSVIAYVIFAVDRLSQLSG